MALDNAKNFAKVTVSTTYDASATSIVLTGGHGAKLPTVPFNATWWNSTDYADPADDPNVEIVRVTARATDTLTVTRGQEGISASTKNTASKTYKMIAGLTAKVINTDIPATVSTWLGKPVGGEANTTIGTLTVDSETVMTLGLIYIPFRIIVNAIVIEATGVNSAGTLDLTVYSEDGQTKVIAVTTASISAAGNVSTAVAAVTLNPGLYYVGINANGASTDVAVRAYSIANVVLFHTVTSQPMYAGTETITADTPPATITPETLDATAITFAAFRFET